MEQPLDFNVEELRTLLLELTPQKRLIFGLLCSERLYPNYLAFADEQAWGDPVALRTALDLTWDAVLGELPSTEEVHGHMKRLEDATPDTEDFESSALVSPALDAAVTAALVLELLERDDKEILVEIASLSRDTVHMNVQDLEHLENPSKPTFEEELLLHPLMQSELRQQRSDLLELATMSCDLTELEHLKETRSAPKVSNIGLGR